jgi:hypothetical protein
MAKFIQLHDHQNTPIKVDPNNIEMMKPSGDSDNPTVIQLTSGTHMKVKETEAQINENIRQSKLPGVL